MSIPEKLSYIVENIQKAGYDPYAQLCGYLQTEDSHYITRTGNARTLIETIDKREIRHYTTAMLKCTA